MLVFSLAIAVSAQVSVTTYQYDNSRAGANPDERILTTSNVNVNQFGKLFSLPVDGYVYGQPLYVSQVAISGKGTHNVVYIATEHDSVYAYDADTNTGANSAALWHVAFLNAAAGVTTVPYQDTGCSQITPEIGITSTPVIDPQSGVIYVVAMTKETAGGSTTYVHRLHALEIRSGMEMPGSPVVVQATYPGTGEGGSTLVFNPKNYKQRPGLLLLNGVVYTAWSSHCDEGAYHGWLIGYDAHSLQQTGIYNNTPNGNEGSFWAGGAAPAADPAGSIYLVAGNGSFNYSSGGPNLGESFIKLSSAAGLSVLDYFTPFNYASLNAADLDTGSSGVALLADAAGSVAHPHLMVGAGKEGRVYLLDRDAPGKLQPGSDSQIVQSLAGAIGGLFGNPAYFNQAVYLCGSGDNLKLFPISNAQLAAAPASQSARQFGFPGCVPTVSASGKTNGIVWILESSGTLHAYDASNLTRELYNSGQNAGRDSLGSYVKFSVPTVVNGNVYAGTQTAVNVYGLLPGGSAAMTVANAASGDATAVAPGSIISIYGPGLAQSTAFPTVFPLLMTMAGASVTIGGVPAPLFYASPNQINAQVPFTIPTGIAAVSVTLGSRVVGTANVAVQGAAPGLFLLAQDHAAALNQDSSVNSYSQPAAVGSVIAAFLTGLGAVDNPVPAATPASANPLSRVLATVTASLGGQPAAVQFAGLAPDWAGLYQVNLVVPHLAPGDYPLQIFVAGSASNAATVSVR
ncbi:MAG TPA: hypothetical protein VLY04_13430 [Bryobacteraceae bacterium]|nr:hypothetical protein [Bryobacteraceae bacterium]